MRPLVAPRQAVVCDIGLPLDWLDSLAAAEWIVVVVAAAGVALDGDDDDGGAGGAGAGVEDAQVHRRPRRPAGAGWAKWLSAARRAPSRRRSTDIAAALAAGKLVAIEIG